MEVYTITGTLVPFHHDAPREYRVDVRGQPPVRVRFDNIAAHNKWSAAFQLELVRQRFSASTMEHAWAAAAQATRAACACAGAVLPPAAAPPVPARAASQHATGTA
jgi:hypothetical protein